MLQLQAKTLLLEFFIPTTSLYKWSLLHFSSNHSYAHDRTFHVILEYEYVMQPQIIEWEQMHRSLYLLEDSHKIPELG